MSAFARGGVRVRTATVADLDAVAPLFDAYRAFYGRASDPDAALAFLRARAERGEAVVLVAEPERAGVVGFAQLYPTFSSLSLSRVVVLNDLFVAPAARGRGVAGQLVDAAAAHARRWGAARLELATQRTNARALALYAAKGFRPDEEFVHLSVALDDVAAGAAPGTERAC